MVFENFRKEFAKYKLIKSVVLTYPGTNPDEERLMRNLKEQFEDHSQSVASSIRICFGLLILVGVIPYMRKNRNSLGMKKLFGMSFILLTIPGIAGKLVERVAGFTKTDYFYEELMKSSQPISEFIKDKHSAELSTKAN
ncbi:unnamed protein product [Blepharisma stoltei]|uniref:Uncharacterized protein n=1 Tax=Blepharisma stoltei TaxID=1481888 RepID=A0AAU9JU76_9CILI|nr:unnamed protein product [Blepharisma stoltei]